MERPTHIRVIIPFRLDISCGSALMNSRFSDNAKVRKIDSEWQCIKCEIFRIKLSHFIHVCFRTFALSHFITSLLQKPKRANLTARIEKLNSIYLFLDLALAGQQYYRTTIFVYITRKVFRIGTVRYHWPMSAHASQAFSIASCTDSEDLPITHKMQQRHNKY